VELFRDEVNIVMELLSARLTSQSEGYFETVRRHGTLADDETLNYSQLALKPFLR